MRESERGEEAHPRRVFVRRQGRITRGQARALDALLPRYGLDRWPDVVTGPVMMDIGFGMGQALASFAEQHPDWTCIGVEVYRPGIGSLLLQCDARGIDNVRVLEGDANVIIDAVPEQAVDLVAILFPDPWPKKRHHKRRLVGPEFTAKIAALLKTGGHLRIATDWQPYAESMLATLDADPSLENAAGRGEFAPRWDERSATRFETRGRRLGHDIWDLDFEKISSRRERDADSIGICRR